MSNIFFFHGTMKKIPNIHKNYIHSVALQVNSIPKLITPAELKKIAFKIQNSKTFPIFSFLFEIFLQSKQLHLPQEDTNRLFKNFSQEFFVWAIQEFFRASQKCNNQLFFISLIMKFKG